MGKKLLDKIKVTPLKIIKLSTGNIMHALNKNELKNRTFGEAYFSKIKSGKIKAWRYHLKMILNLVVPYGKVKFWFVDGRKNYSSYYKEDKIVIGKRNYKIILVPPKIWFSFKSLSKISIVVNCIENPHSENETLKSTKIKSHKIEN